MPTPLNNQASIRYNYNNNTASGSASSNTVTTNLLDEYTLTATKTALSATFRPGENITYIIRVVNNGSGDLYNVVVSDDLGGGLSAPLVYNQSSLRAFVNCSPVAVAPNAEPGVLTVTLPAPLPAGSVAILVYTVRVRANIPFSLQSITNAVAISANGGSSGGAPVAVSPSPTATILREAYADLTIYKEADKQNVMAGDTLTYTFTLTNLGNQEAESVTLTDTLPDGFDVTRVAVTTGGVTTVLDSDDIMVDSENTITMPSAAGPAIRVPAATSTAPGTTVVTVTGTVASST